MCRTCIQWFVGMLVFPNHRHGIILIAAVVMGLQRRHGRRQSFAKSRLHFCGRAIIQIFLWWWFGGRFWMLQEIGQIEFFLLIVVFQRALPTGWFWWFVSVQGHALAFPARPQHSLKMGLHDVCVVLVRDWLLSGCQFQCLLNFPTSQQSINNCCG